ncbi:MAG: hypothetical protein DRQ60_08500 [Gammaproteobacteria bacterium]|nr:MAG: hypothetical protein DRQ54_03425 [Gammaproteobacteria bacterium]RLA11096.1 MAG: hypothetical protein DRQ52_10250 [Gammaproteobacteria bacterium]RLA12605.1 MAG: hypothetical protein DRQ60_08500 [Gammaproteobacteria bacterium]
MQERSEKTGGSSIPVCVVITLSCLLMTGLYAYTRYVYFGPIAESKIPLYISNKAISWSSVLLLCSSFAVGPLAKLTDRCQKWVAYRQVFGLTGLWLATLHILVSMPIFNMFYYTGFFNLDGTLKVTTELSMLAGAVAWMVLLFPAVVSLPAVAASMPAVGWRRVQRLGLVALLIIFSHVAWLGWSGWFLPADWFGGLPPITLISCGVIALLMLLRLTAALMGNGVND